MTVYEVDEKALVKDLDVVDERVTSDCGDLDEASVG